MTHPSPSGNRLEWKSVSPRSHLLVPRLLSLALSWFRLLLALFTVQLAIPYARFLCHLATEWQTHLRPQASAELIRNREQDVPSAGGDV